MEPTLAKITGQVLISNEDFASIEKTINNITSFKKAIEISLKKEITKTIEIIFGGATILEASDIHLEPEERQVKIRVRIDGILQDIMTISPESYQPLLSRIKLLSGLKFNISDRPQDGRFTMALPDAFIEIRTSSLPAEYGESIVCRILNPQNLIKIEELGLRKDLLNIVAKEIEKPNGMIIVTGPTGSGKTTTLYAFLKKIQTPGIKIITIEDPIEYHLEGISQTQVAQEKGYDFANGLKSIMRQDPDVILVGEIRDLETATIALQASLTGHLVLSTLHTNDATGTIARLQALGEKPVNIAPALNMAIAQRLVRKVCKKCSSLETISPDVFNELKTGLKAIPKNIKIPAFDRRTKILKPKGCSECNFTGYKGRVGVFEAFLVDADIEKLILKSPSISELREKTIQKGMITMYQDGLIKVLEGVTTLEEVKRVVAEN
jgi:type II secretory ATPase GspE/PulE/Tfp pilus assembly ATPase PilB-like protein